MSLSTPVPAAEVQERFGYFQDRALVSPILISSHGRPTTVLVSYEEYVRLKERDRRAHGLDDMPDEVAAAILEARVPDALG